MGEPEQPKALKEKPEGDDWELEFKRQERQLDLDQKRFEMRLAMVQSIGTTLVGPLVLGVGIYLIAVGNNAGYALIGVSGAGAVGGITSTQALRALVAAQKEGKES